MANKKKILFIINPKSGTTGKNDLPTLIKKYLDHNLYDHESIFTQYAGEASEISARNKDLFDVIVAIGGDGTINEVAHPLTHSNTVLGIIPRGSGNGLARHLRIPLSPKKAIELLNTECSMAIDTISLNEKCFLNVAGVGFDAHVAQLFAGSKKRGFFSYARLAMNEITKFRSIDYQLIIDGKEKIEKAPFLISIANSAQWGNNAYIAPNALISDGLMDICVLRKLPKWYWPILTYRLFTKTLTKSRYYKTWQGKDVEINILTDTENKYMHIDGDPYRITNNMKLSINPLSLRIACNKL